MCARTSIGDRKKTRIDMNVSLFVTMLLIMIASIGVLVWKVTEANQKIDEIIEAISVDVLPELGWPANVSTTCDIPPFPAAACLPEHRIDDPADIAIFMFGLTRSLRHTYKTIKHRIFRPLNEHGITFHLYAHFYLIRDGYIDARTLETTRDFVNDEWAYLSPYTRIELQNQTDFDNIRSEYTDFHSTIIPYNDMAAPSPRDTMHVWRNTKRQLHSVSRCMNMAACSGVPYRAVIFLRPDVLYYEDLPIPLLRFCMNSQKAAAVVLNWGWDVNFIGHNDRFYMTNWKGAISLAYRGRKSNLDTYERDTDRSWWPENVFGWTINKCGIEKRVTDYPFDRVRANGWLVPDSCEKSHMCFTDLSSAIERSLSGPSRGA